MAADDREIGHADHLGIPFLDEGKLAHLLDVTRPGSLDFKQEELVDLENDLQMTGKHFVKESHAPSLECLGKKRMVGVGEGPGDDLPGLFPGQTVHIVQESLKLDHGDRRVGVVKLDGNLLGKIVPVLVAPAEAADDVLQRAGHKEILLNQTQLLAALRLVIGIEDF